MPMKAAGRKQQSEASDRRLIQQSMSRWELMDRTGRSIGRGLGKKGLISRVAREVGKTCQEVQLALKGGK